MGLQSSDLRSTADRLEWLSVAERGDILHCADLTKGPKATAPPNASGNELCPRCCVPHYGNPCYNRYDRYGERIRDEEPDAPRTLTSTQARLLQGLVGEERGAQTVTEALVSALCVDLVTGTAQDSAFLGELLENRTAVLGEVANSLRHERYSVRANIMRVPDKLEGSSTVLQLNIDLLCSVLKAQTASITSAAAAAGIAASPITPVMLDKLEMIFDQPAADSAKPTLLELVHNPEAEAWASPIVEWLVTVIRSTQDAPALQDRAIAILLQLILRLGSLRTALRALDVFLNHPSSSPSPTTAQALRDFLNTLSTVSVPDSVELNTRIADSSGLYCGSWKAGLPNFTETGTGDDDDKADNNNNNFGRKRGFIHRRGRRMRRRYQDDADEEQNKDESQPENYSSLAVSADGAFVYVHSQDGLHKVGTGSAGSRRGRVYAMRSDFCTRDQGWLCCVRGVLIFRKPVADTELLVLSADTLEDVPDAQLALPEDCMPSVQSPIVTCGERLYVVRQLDGPTDFEVCIFALDTSAPALALNLERRARLGNVDMSLPRQLGSCARCARLLTPGPYYACPTCEGSSAVFNQCYDCQRVTHRDQHHKMNKTPPPDALGDFPCWYHPKISGNEPSARFAAASCAGGPDGNLFFIFGGGSGHPLLYIGDQPGVDMLFNDLIVLNTADNAWVPADSLVTVDTATAEPLEGECDAPTPRLGSTLVALDANRLMLFGGSKDDTGLEANNELFIYHIDRGVWTRPHVSGTVPGPRTLHGVCMVDRVMFVFGGMNSDTTHSDLFQLDTNDWKWSQVQVAGTIGAVFGPIVCHIEEPLSSDVDGIRSQICVIGGGNAQQPSWACQYIDLRDRDEGKPLRWKTMTSLSPYCHYLAGSAHIVQKDRIYVFGGGHNGSFTEQVSRLRFGDPAWEHYFSFHGTPPSRRAYASFAAIGNKLYVFGGGDDTGCKSQLSVFHTSTDPSVPLTAPCLREALFFTDGHTLNAHIPPLLPPNVVVNNEYITRTFALDKSLENIDPAVVEDEIAKGNVNSPAIKAEYDADVAPFLFDHQCSSKRFGGSIVFDRANNLIWVHDRATQTLHRWVNTAHIDAITLDLTPPDWLNTSSGALTYTDASARLLHELARMAGLYTPNTHVLDPVRSTADQDFEPFVVDTDSETFDMLARLLEHFADAAKADQRLASFATQCVLKILLLNVQRVVNSEDRITAAAAQRLTAALQRVDDADCVVLVHQVFALGLRIFFPYYQDRAQWLCSFFEKHGDNAELASWVVSRVTSSSFVGDVLAPHSWQEGRMPVRAAVPENKDDKAQTAFAKRVNELVLDKSTTFAQNDLVVLQHAIPGTHFYPMQVVIGNSSTPNIPGLGSAMLFVAETAEELNAPGATAPFDDFTHADYDAWLEAKLASGEPFTPLEPIAFIDLADSDHVKTSNHLNLINLSAQLYHSGRSKGGKVFGVKFLHTLDTVRAAARAAQQNRGKKRRKHTKKAADSDSSAKKVMEKSTLTSFNLCCYEQTLPPHLPADLRAAVRASKGLALLKKLIDMGKAHALARLSGTDSALSDEAAEAAMQLLACLQLNLVTRAHDSVTCHNSGEKPVAENEQLPEITAASFQTPLFLLLVEYMDYLFAGSQEVAAAYAQRGATTAPVGVGPDPSDDDAVDETLLGELRSTLLGRLLPPLVTALHPFTVFPSFAQLTLPAMQPMMGAVTQVCSLHAEELQPFEESYMLPDSDARVLSFCVARCRQVRGDAAVEEEEEEDDEAADDGGADAESAGDVPCHVATCDHKARTAHGLMRHIKMHHLGVAKTLGSLRHHWALDLLRTLGTLCARSAASLTIGNPASESEELQGKWLDSPLFQQGLQLSALLPRLEDLEKRREEEPILRGMERKQALREARDIGAYPALGEVHAQFGLLHWETADDVRAKLTSGEEKSLAAHDAFLDDFVHARKDGKTHGAFLAEVAPGGGGAAGRARFLMAGGGVGMQGSMAALKHTRVHEALRYVIAAVLKVRGLVPEAMTFAHLLAVSGGAGGAPGVGKLRSIPKNLRPVWQAARNMLQWISRERQEQFARWTMMEELKKAQAQKRREEERRRRAAEGHESDSDDDSGDEFKDGADDPEAEAQQAEEELDIYAVIANRIIAKAALLLKVRPWGVSEEQANKSEAPSAGDAASTAASSDGTADDDDTAMPQLRRAVSADPQGIKSGGSSSPRERSTDDADLDSAPPMPRLMRSLSTAAPSEVTKHSASVQRRARKRDILSMWKSILHPDASEAMPELARAWSVENSPLTDAAARAAAISGSAFQAPELDPWRQPYGRSRHLPSGREGRNSPPTELILFFLQNEREVDPAAESLSDKKIEADPTLLLLPSERRKALNVEMVEQLLLDRRARAYSRAAGLQAFQQMLSGVGGKRTFRSVVHLVLCHLLPALRGEAVLSQREKYDDQRRYPDKYSKYNEDGTEKEDANKSEKQKSEEAARRPFRYTDGTLGCGADLTGRIRRGCKELFFNLTALLKASCSAMSVSLAGPMRLLDARTPSPTPAAVAPQNDPSVPSLGFTSKREAQRLALALLGAWAMRFTEEDHAFLHRCGVLPVLRRLMSQRARGATGSAPATQARAGSDEAKMDDKLRALARSAFLVLATRAFDARSTTTTKSKALETASERLARLLASDDEDDDNDDDAGSSDTTRPLNALQQSVIELTFSILDECSSALYSESTGASKTTDIDAMQSRALFEESSYGMLGLIITVCERGGRAAVRYISTPRLMRPLLFMMERGTPRMQRYVCRLMRKLLPEQHPRSLTIGSHATALDYLIDQIGSLLVSEDEQPEDPKADAAASSESAELPKVLRKPARTAGVRQALASELVALVRSLMLTPTWLDVIQEALANGLSHLPTLLSQGDDEARAAGEAQAAAAALAAAEEDDEDDGKADEEEEEDAPVAQAVEANAQPSVLRTRKFEMWRATAALCIIGGMREPLRVGGTVEVFASNNPKKRKRATLLSHDSVTGTASVVYDASVTKLVEDLPKNSRIVAQDEIPFDPRLFPLTSSSTELLEALRMLLAQAAAGERDSTASTVGGGDDDDDLMPEELVRATSASSSMVAPAEHPVQKQPTLALLHLRSRAMRALWSLLLHKESAVTLLEAGVGPDLTTAAHSSSPQVLSDPQQMEVAEHALSQLMQLCAQRGLTHRRIAGSGAERAFQLQAERLPHNPYNTWRCVLPSSMTTTSKKLTVEGEDRCVVLSNRRLREWEDYCPAWSTVAIPDEIPSFYYEITHVNPHENGYTMMGFYAADKPFRGELGSTPGSVCLTSDGWGSHATAGGGGCSSERWQQGDVIGAGWDKRTGRVFFTQNGKLVKCTYTLSERKRYHPAIVISAPGARFLFNFGQQPFRFNFAESKYFPKTKEEMKGSGAADTNGVSVSAGSGKTVDRAAEARARAKKKAASSSGSPDPEAEFEAMLMKKKQGGMEALVEEEPKKGGGADGGDDGGDAPSGPAGAQPAPAQGAPAPAAAGANAGAAPPAPGTPAAAAATGAPAGADGAPAAGADGAAANGQQPQDAQQGQPVAQTQQAEEEEEEEPPARNNNNNNLGNESDFEDDAASVEEDPDQNNNRYYDSDDEYDEYGNKKDKNARKPLGNEEVFVGATLMVHKSSEGQQSSNRSNPQFAWRPEMQATIGRSGTVLHVDRGSRMVMLSIVFPETAEEVHYWYSMSCLCKVDRFVNADLDSVQSLNSMDSKDILLRTADTELSLSVAYVRHALMSVLAFWPGDQQEDRARRAKETEAKAEVDPGVFRASFVGGAEELLHVLNRVALDELGDTSKSNKKAAKQVQAAVASVQTLLTLEQTELSHDTGGKDALIAPHDVASRNPLAVLGRLFWRMLTAEDADEQLVRLLAREAMHEAQHAKLDGGDDDWVRKLHQLQHVRYTCWLLNLLMTAHETDPESEQCARIAQYVYNADVATLLIGLLEPNRDAKKFKMTAVFSSVAQVLSRLLGRVDLFPVEQLVEPKPRFYVVDSDGHKNLGVDPAEKDAEVVPPGDDQPSVLNLDSLNWLIELMNGRHKIETANTPGSTTEPHSARSKTLQILVNSVLVLEQAKEDVRAKLAGGKVVAPVEVEKEVEKEVEEEEEDGKEPSDDEDDDDDDEEKADSDDDEEKEDSDEEEEEEEEAAAEATKTTDKAEDDVPFESLQIGANFHELGWFERVEHVSQLMKRLLHQGGFPDWMARASWLDSQKHNLSVTRESEHPYVKDVEWSKIEIPHAEKVTVRLHSKSSTDGSDFLRFAAEPPASDGRQPALLGNLSGTEMNLPDDRLEVEGNCVWFSFSQSQSPTHAQCFCSHCEYPIKGKRYVCAVCKGDFNFCEACERNNMDEGRHDRSHILFQVRRPVPRDYEVPRVLPRLESFYEKDMIRKLNAGFQDDKAPHPGTSCSGCGQSPIVGVLHKCVSCEGFELCSGCEKELHREATPDAPRTLEHDLAHIFVKIRYPVKTLRPVANAPLSQFIESFQSTHVQWGFSFTVVPTFPASYQKQLLDKHAQDVARVVQEMTRDGPDMQAANRQVVELVNRACSKRTASNAPKVPQRGNRRRRHHNRGAVAERHVEREYLPLIMPPSDMASNQKDLVMYTQLESMEMEMVHQQFGMLRLLNERLLGVLPLINWGAVEDKWTLSHVFGRLRGLIFWEMKVKLWLSALSRSVGNSNSNRRVQLDNVKASQAKDMAGQSDVLDVIESSLFGQLYSQLRSFPASGMRTQGGQPWTTRYKQESGVDAGGLFRDSLTQICTELQSPHIPLFIPCPNARHSVGITLDKNLPHSGLTAPIYMSMYEFVGKLMGVAIRCSNPLSLDLPSLVWKTLVGTEPDRSDVQAIDEICVKAMDALLNERELREKGVNEDNFQDVYGFTFTYSASDETIVELKENGRNTPVTWADRQEYADLVIAMRLQELKPQMQALRRGLIQVIPARFLSLLTWKELELEVCGSPEIDIDLLKTNTVYSGCGPSDQHIKHFWEVLEEFTQLERAQFLRFVWGRSRLPPANKFTEKFKIHATSMSTAALPCSHTCFATLELPAYPTKEILRNKLYLAITMCTSIDNV